MNEAGPRSLTSLADRRAATLRGISLATIVASVALILRRLPIGPALASLETSLAGLGPWGPVAFGIAYVAAVVALVPASPLTLAAGALFGVPVGTVTVSIASTTGAALAFLVARYLAREAVARRLRRSPRFAAIDRAIGEGGWKVVALLRLSPAVPFNLQNYLFGLTGVRFWPYVLTSWAAMLPGTLLYISLGHAGRAGLEAASGGARARGPAEWAMIAVGLLATLAVTVYVTRLARHAMRQQAEIAGALGGGEGADPKAPGPGGRPRATALLAALAILAAGAAAFSVWYGGGP
jgi:uncharacterized membrane protein YdjX (TVP38/TMEM64 family)